MLRSLYPCGCARGNYELTSSLVQIQWAGQVAQTAPNFHMLSWGLGFRYCLWLKIFVWPFLPLDPFGLASTWEERFGVMPMYAAQSPSGPNTFVGIVPMVNQVLYRSSLVWFYTHQVSISYKHCRKAWTHIQPWHCTRLFSLIMRLAHQTS